MSGDFVPDFGYRKLSFIRTEAEELNQLQNTAIMKSIAEHSGKFVPLRQILVQSQYGFTAPAKDSGNARLLRITDLNEGVVDWATVPYCDCPEVDKYALKNGDILIARTGGTTGKTVLVQDPELNAVFASYLIRLTVGESYLPEFVFRFLNSYLFWNQILEMKNGSAQPNVNAEKMKELLVPKCSIEEQLALIEIRKGGRLGTSSVVTRAQEIIETTSSVYRHVQGLEKETDQQSSLLTQLRQAILQEAIEGKLTAGWRQKHPVVRGDPETDAAELLSQIQDEKVRLAAEGTIKKPKPLAPIREEETPFTLPQRWVWTRLEEQGFLVGGGTPTTSNAEYWNGDIPWVSPKDMKHDVITCSIDTITERGLLESSARLIPSGSVLFVVRGMILLHTFPVGICAVPVAINQDMKALVPYVPESRFFISRMLKGFSARILQLTNTSTHGTKRLEYSESYSRLVFPLPPLAEQRVIVERVERLLAMVDELEQQVADRKRQAEALLQTVLAEAFREVSA